MNQLTYPCKISQALPAPVERYKTVTLSATMLLMLKTAFHDILSEIENPRSLNRELFRLRQYAHPRQAERLINGLIPQLSAFVFPNALQTIIVNTGELELLKTIVHDAEIFLASQTSTLNLRILETRYRILFEARSYLKSPQAAL